MPVDEQGRVDTCGTVAARPDSNDARLRWLALAGFVAVSTVLMFLHEPWRDEVQPWLIARNSDSLSALVHNTRAEGHPLLWFLVLWIPAHLTRSFLALQAIHLAIATAAAACVLWRAPFSRWQRVAFVFGYFPLYEYGPIARNYAPGMLLLFIGLILASRRPRPYVPLALVIVLMASTSAYALIIGAALGTAVVIDDWVRWRWYGEEPPWRAFALAVGGLVVGAIVVVVQYLPALSSSAASGFTNAVYEDRVRGALAPFAGLIPIPQVATRFWGTSIVDGFASGPVRVVVGGALLVGLAWVLRDRLAALWMWCVGVLMLGVLSLQGYQGYTHHAGHFYLLFVAACWLAPASAPWREHRFPIGPRRTRTPSARARVVALGVLLVIHLIAVVVPVEADVTHPFSGAKRMAGLLERKGYAHADLVLWQGVDAVALLAELDRGGYFAELHHIAHDQEWYSKRYRTTDASVARLMRKRCHSLRRPSVLVTTFRQHDPEYVLVARVTDTIVDSEEFFAYRVRGCPIPRSA